ncbi:MAG TPA: PHP domain-containing protein [Coriobacteriia bacterium]
MHTTASDGISRPEDVVAAALDLGLTAIAITDHDSVDGVGPALEAAEGRPVEVVPGVELSASFAGRDLHILGYFVDHADADLDARLVVLRHQRLDRAQAMVAALVEAGHTVTFEGVMAHANGGAVGRSHVARALVEAGDVDSVEDAFAQLIGRDAPFFVEKPLLPADEAIRLIHDAGGVAVLAHPSISRADDVISGLATQGLDGIEAYHAEHDLQRRARYAEIAERLGLVATGGSDFHGARAKGGKLGTADPPDACLEQLRLLARPR